MSSAPIDPEAFRDAQRAQWGSAAAAWHAWSPVFEAGVHALGERMLDLVRIGPGARVLDVGTGIGEPALGAARRVGNAGFVLGIDLAPEMLAFARERAAGAGLVNVEFRAGDAAEIALAPSSFDAALSRFGVMLFGEPARALAAIRSALRPGGTFACAVWGTPARVPFIAIPIEVAERELALDPPAPGTPGPLSLGQPGDLEALLGAAGFRDVVGETQRATIEFASAAEHVRFLQEVSGSLRKALAGREPSDAERVWSAIARATLAHGTDDGRIRFDNDVRIVTGTR